MPLPLPGSGSQKQSGPRLPSAILQKQRKARNEERKRTREEIEAAGEEARKHAKDRTPGVEQQAESPKELARTAEVNCAWHKSVIIVSLLSNVMLSSPLSHFC